jgi:hypothetical protein
MMLSDNRRPCIKCGGKTQTIIEITTEEINKYRYCQYHLRCTSCYHTGSPWSTVNGAKVAWDAENQLLRTNIVVEEALDPLTE